MPIIVVGNKCDRVEERVITQSKAESFCYHLGLDHYSSSAKTGENVVKIFRTLTERKWTSLSILTENYIEL